jgi:hypothetical protein
MKGARSNEGGLRAERNCGRPPRLRLRPRTSHPRMTSVTTTTFSVMSTGHDLARLTPTAWLIVVPLVAFAVVAMVMGLVAIRHRRG